MDRATTDHPTFLLLNFLPSVIPTGRPCDLIE